MYVLFFDKDIYQLFYRNAVEGRNGVNNKKAPVPGFEPGYPCGNKLTSLA